MSDPRTDTGRRPGRRWRFLGYPFRLGLPGARFNSSPFSRLAVVHACSAVGDGLVTVALAGSVFVSVSLSAARSRVALGLVITILPFAVVAPFLGPVIDRVRGGRRFMVLLSALGRAVACLLMARSIHSLLLFPAALLSLISSKTYLVSKASLVPAAVDHQDQLVEANAKLAIGSSIATSLAAAAGAAIFKMFDSQVVLYVDIVVLLACAGLTFRIEPARPEPTGAALPPFPPVEGATPQPAVEPRVLPPGGLELAAVAMATLRFIAGFVTFLIVFSFRRSATPVIWYGIVAVGSVAGNLGGAALAPWLRHRIREDRIVSASIVLVALVAFGLSQLPVMHRWPAAFVLGTAVGLAASVAKLAFDAIVQRDTPAAGRGRLFARFEAIFQLVWVVGALVPVVIPMSLGLGFTLVGAVALVAAVIFVGGVYEARRNRLPAWWPGQRRPVLPAVPRTVIAGPVGQPQGDWAGGKGRIGL